MYKEPELGWEAGKGWGGVEGGCKDEAPLFGTETTLVSRNTASHLPLIRLSSTANVVSKLSMPMFDAIVPEILSYVSSRSVRRVSP